MFSKKEIQVKLGSYPGLEFHYKQVCNLIQTLQWNYDEFRPLTLFESMAINIQDQKRVLAQLLYKYTWKH